MPQSYSEQYDIPVGTEITIAGQLVNINLIQPDPRAKYKEYNLILAHPSYLIENRFQKQLKNMMEDKYNYPPYLKLPFKKNKKHPDCPIIGHDDPNHPMDYQAFVDTLPPDYQLKPGQLVKAKFRIYYYNDHQNRSQTLSSMEISSLQHPMLIGK